jgi:hypothetical protein
VTNTSPFFVSDLDTVIDNERFVTVVGARRICSSRQATAQPNGGAFNSTYSAGTITLGSPLANGASINLRFLLGIQQTGNFRFFINGAALP